MDNWDTESAKGTKNDWDTERAKTLNVPCKYIGAYGRYKNNVSVQIHRCRRWDCVKGCGMMHKQKLIDHFTKLLKDKTLYVKEFEFEGVYWRDMQTQISHSRHGFLLVKTVIMNEEVPWWTGKAVLIMDHMVVATKVLEEDITEYLERIIPDRAPSETERSRPVAYSRGWAPPKEEREVSEDRVVVRYLPQKFVFWVAGELGIEIGGRYLRVDDESWKKLKDAVLAHYKEICSRIWRRCKKRISQMTDERQEKEIVKESNLVMKEAKKAKDEHSEGTD